MVNVTLGDCYERYVNELVESGRYRSVSEVIRSGPVGPLDIADIKTKARARMTCK